MGLFGRNAKKEHVQKTVDELTQLHIKVRAVYALSDIFDEEVLHVEANDPAGLHYRIHRDLSTYMLRIAEADGEIDPEEVEIINDFLDCELEQEEYEGIIHDLNAFGFGYLSTIPKSFTIMKEYHSVCIVDDIASCLIGLYDALGTTLALSDGHVDGEERREINNYVAMLSKFARWQ